jgi:hypothetical protein
VTDPGEEFDERWGASVRRAEDMPAWDRMTLKEKAEFSSLLKRMAHSSTPEKSVLLGSPKSSSRAGSGPGPHLGPLSVRDP